MRTCVRDLGPTRRSLRAGACHWEPRRRGAGAFEIAFIPLADARALVELYAENGDPKFERAALKYLARYLAEANPSMDDVARVAALLPSATCSCAGCRSPAVPLPLPTPARPMRALGVRDPFQAGAVDVHRQ